MPENTATYRNVEVGDRLNQLMADYKAKAAGNTSAKSFQPQAMINPANTVNIHDTLTADNTTNYASAVNTVNVAATVAAPTSAGIGGWQIPMDSNNTTGVANPILAVGEFEADTV